jgi:uncharacterized BrkB/YihY/UPF0761 family membrane protein
MVILMTNHPDILVHSLVRMITASVSQAPSTHFFEPFPMTVITATVIFILLLTTGAITTLFYLFPRSRP